jgi:hypothetical protein
MPSTAAKAQAHDSHRRHQRGEDHDDIPDRREQHIPAHQDRIVNLVYRRIHKRQQKTGDDQDKVSGRHAIPGFSELFPIRGLCRRRSLYLSLNLCQFQFQ